MKSKLTLCVFLVSSLISWTFGNNDPCVGYKVITDERRSAQYSSSKTEANICDLDIDESVWHRFDVLPPKRLHDSCVSELKCGTEQPIWLQGEHPTAVDPGPKDVRVCSPRDNDCCGGWSSMIKVKYCRAGGDDFYVYLLKKPPRCVMAYCAGNTVVCPEGQIWNEFIELCTEPNPRITVPAFTGPHREPKTIKVGLDTEPYDDFYFNCIITWVNPRPDKQNQGEQFKVVFTFDGREEHSVPAKITDGSKLSIHLWSNELVGHAGKTVSCMVRTYWRKLEQVSSPYRASTSNYFVGIRYNKEGKGGPFTSPLIEIDENSDGLTLHFQPTVPISCPLTDHKTTCKFQVVIQDMSQNGVAVSDCSIVFTALDPNMAEWTLKIKPRPTPGIYSRTAVIRFLPIVTDPEFFWHNYKLPDITILITDKPTAATGFCSSCGDPHIKTFDGRFYDAFMEGDYLLAKSTSPRHFEVHVRHHRCNDVTTVTCNCAVAVREGNNILGVYACDKPKYRPTPVRYLSDPDAPGATITNNGKEFRIMMPSGAHVKMVWNVRNSAIYLYLNSEDYSKTSGLCGTFNRNKNDDTMAKGTQNMDNRIVPVTFSESYRLKADESFFNGNIFPIKCEDFKAAVPSICSCENKRVTGCSVPENVAKAFGTKFTDHCTKLKNPLVPPNRRRRALDLNETETYDEDEFQKDDITKDEDILTDEDMPLVTFDENYGRNVAFTWPTTSGLSESEARRQCQLKMESSPVFNLCKDQISDRLDGILKSCVTDIQISDNITTSISYIIDNLQTNCIQKMESSIVRNENDTSPPSPTENLLREIMSKVCPDECNNNGECRNGICRCDVGFGGEDCSVNIREPPRIFEFRKGDKCDRQKFPCSQTSIFAINFYRSDELVCKVKHLGLSNEFVFGASIVSSQEVSCKLPTVEHVADKSARHRRNLKTENISAAPFHHFEITLTNDGNLYSNSLRMTVYDSKCQECHSDGKCTRKPETCVIDGRCYLTYETSSSNNCSTCLPSISADKWTTVKSEKCSSGCSLDVSTFLAISAIIATLYLLK